jgi:SAM-dependent methyltransferase
MRFRGPTGGELASPPRYAKVPPRDHKHQNAIGEMSEQVNADQFARWEGRYAAPGYHFGTEPNAFLKSQVHLLRRGQTALAIADGEGRNGVWLAEQGLNVLSVDFSPTALAKARALAAARGVALRTECADINSWTWPPAAFDVIIGIFVQFPSPPGQARMFDGIRGALRPGGLLLLEGYGPKQLQYGTGGPREIGRLYTSERLAAAFAGFASLDIREYDASLNEGAHVGMSALVDLIGRK